MIAKNTNMNQQPGSSQNTGSTPNPSREAALQSFLAQQGMYINKLQQTLQSNAIVSGFKAFVSGFLELLMYLMFAGALVVAIFIPTDPVSYTQHIDETSSFNANYHSDEITGIMITIKIAIVVLAIPLLFCAVLLRRNRSKNQLIGQAYAETKTMRQMHEQAIQYFRN